MTRESEAVTSRPDVDPESSGRTMTALSTVRDTDLRDLLALAADLLDVEVAAVTVADGDDFHYPVAVGIEPFSTPYAAAMCRQAWGHGELFEVPDTLLDPRFTDSPFVTGELASVRFYASFPLSTSTGEETGRFCLFGLSPRRLDDAQRRVVATLAVAANRILELRLRRLAPMPAPTADVLAIAAQVSHDLQSPLATLMMSLGVLQGEELDSTTRASVLAMATRSVERMRGMVEGTLRLHDLGREAPGHETVDLRALTEQLLADEAEQWDQVGGTVDLGELPPVVGDPTQLTLVLQNLLHNARKFARPGQPPEVAVRAERRGDRVRVTVRDAGVGIPAGHRSRVFDLFTRTGHAQGHGIGLATVARVVHAHGGDCGTEDLPEGAGAALWFELPAG
ncbi:sensor histidine kinase [Nocardioides dokdonensis]|uniref:sensor histidine kinase n=1 Tax=Nocardioides dokdonensis TaxID=450734 RepID=UPI0012FBE1AE|nr:HAMP domain-containing sensor histidine kinase [Nocardioides dokdonensis]